MGVFDGVSPLQVGFGVKRKALDSCRGRWGTEGGDASRVVSATVVMYGYCTLTRQGEIMSRTANAVRTLRSTTPARLSLNDTILKRLAQNLERMAAELGQFIQEEHPLMGQRHFARHRNVSPADQPRHPRWCGVVREMGGS